MLVELPVMGSSQGMMLAGISPNPPEFPFACAAQKSG
jgi:hypothetical protein